MIKIGLYYQSGYRYVPCFYALEQFRKVYPNAPISLYEDNSNVLLPIAKKFKCDYKKTIITGRNGNNNGRESFDLKSTKAWFERINEACTTVLSEADWIVHFEDDVWIRRELRSEPPYDLSGIGGIGCDVGLYEHLQTSVRGAYGCGGSMFNRIKFIEAYKKINEIDWDLMDKLAISPKPSEWADTAITILFLYSKMSVGPYNELVQYRNSKAQTLLDRRGWLGSMQELEEEQGDVAIIHCWKPYYYPTEEEVIYVEKKLAKKILN